RPWRTTLHPPKLPPSRPPRHLHLLQGPPSQPSEALGEGPRVAAESPTTPSRSGGFAPTRGSHRISRREFTFKLLPADEGEWLDGTVDGSARCRLVDSLSLAPRGGGRPGQAGRGASRGVRTHAAGSCCGVDAYHQSIPRP